MTKVSLRVIFTSVAATLLACPGVGQTIVPPPQVRCEPETAVGAASLCVFAVALELGPTDQVEAYAPIRGMWLALEAVETRATDADSRKKATSETRPATEPSRKELDTSLATDHEGRLYTTVVPGTYRICASGESLITPPRRVSSCQDVELEEGAPKKLLISHSPFGDLLSFSWQAP